MSQSPRQLITLVSAALAEAPAWRESSYSYPAFPGDESRQTQDHRFAVGDLGERFRAPDRQVAAQGAIGDLVLGVRWAIRTRGTQADYLEALDAEGELVAALKGSTVIGSLVRFTERLAPQLAGDGTVVVGEFRVSIVHGYPLS